MHEIRESAQGPLAGQYASNFGESWARDLRISHLRQGLERLSHIAASVTDLPPQPSTLRGRVGGVLARLVRRAMFWQYAQAKSYIELLNLHLGSAVSALDELERQNGLLKAELTRLNIRLSQQSEIMTTALDRHGENIGTVRQQIASLDQDLARQESAQSEKLQLVESRACERTESVERELSKLERHTSQTRRDLTLVEQRISDLLAEARGRGGSSEDRQQQQYQNPGDTHRDLAGLYLSFEDAFRGSRADIEARVSEYLPVLDHHGISRQSDRIIDLGCGRGEWLQVLGKEGYRASGCDSNSAMVAACRDQGLEVALSGFSDFLRTIPDDSVGVVTAFHVAEHLSLDALLDLIDSSLRVLRRDGILILETPNPQNVLVGLHTFYIDPTHERPLPALLLQFLVEARGFCKASTMYMHPYHESALIREESEVSRRFNEYFYGPQDYAIIARRP